MQPSVETTYTDQDIAAFKAYLFACSDCEMKKCCKKYKEGKRCKKCPKR